MMYGRVGHAQAQYLETDLVSRIEGASSHALVTLLYEQLVEAIEVMVARLSRGGMLGRDRQSQRAQSILVALQASLDFSKGGAVAKSLGAVYQSMTNELGRAISEQDAARLNQLRGGVMSIADAWRKIGPPQQRAA
jgi:flagellar secretion chaperone FliS